MAYEVTDIFSANLHDKKEFAQFALQAFQHQYNQNLVYRSFVDLIRVQPKSVLQIEEIPFLPVSFFKNHKVKSGDFQSEIIFSSSSTTGLGVSMHEVKNLQDYLKTTAHCFNHFKDDFRNYCHLALLPSYLERNGSSLVAMMEFFTENSIFRQSDFYLYDHEKLAKVLQDNRQKSIPTILWGVTYALLDFAENYTLDFPNLIIIETGGMKGKRKEITRTELHKKLEARFTVQSILSEYGMTEMLSQCYSVSEGVFDCPPWVKVLGRDIQDPLSVVTSGRNKALNIIDLANINSCCFLALEDVGHIHPEGTFEVLGRMDFSDVRGCNLMVKG